MEESEQLCGPWDCIGWLGAVAPRDGCERAGLSHNPLFLFSFFLSFIFFILKK